MTKTQSLRIKGNGDGETVGKLGQLTALSLIFAFIFPFVGLILYFPARKKDGKSTLLTAALVISLVMLFFWIFAMIGWAFASFLFIKW